MSVRLLAIGLAARGATAEPYIVKDDQRPRMPALKGLSMGDQGEQA